MRGAITADNDELPCPECGTCSWNDLGCLQCGLEFFPPSQAYQRVCGLSIQQKVRALIRHGQPLPVLTARASPVEKRFWAACSGRFEWSEELVPEYTVPGTRYRLDFALPEQKIGIELDGFATHSSTGAIARDRQRQRAIERAGWRVIRFGGSEVHHDAEHCARQADELIRMRLV